MSDDDHTLRIQIDSRGMAWLFLVLGVGVTVVGVLVFGTNEPWYGALAIVLVGLAFCAVTLLLRDHAVFTFDRHAGTLTWERCSWLGMGRTSGRVPLQSIRRARVTGTGGRGGDAATYRCVLDLDRGTLPLTRAEDSHERVHLERARRIQAWLDAGRASS